MPAPFRCRNPECQQRVFAERLPDIPAWGRRSDRISTLLAYTALSVGGLPGRRVARLYGFAYRRHTLLRAARQRSHWDNRALSALVLILLATQYVLGVLDVTLLAPVWLQIVHLLGADVLWSAIVVLAARLTVEPVEMD